LLIIEVNSLPGMTPATAIFHQAALNGYKPYDFIDKILTFAMNKREYRKNSLPSSVPFNAPVMSSPDPEPATDPTSRENPADTGPKKPSGPLALETVKRFFKRTWEYIWEYISSPYFLKNLIGLIAAIFLLFSLTAILLRWYTNHGKSYEVHNYQDMKLEDATQLAGSRGFRVEVDTGFNLGKARGVVLQQTPLAGSQVKKNRTIYLVVNGKEAPLVKIPSLAVVDNYATYCADARSREVNCKVRAEEYNAKLAKGTIERVYLNGNDITRRLRNGEMRVPKGSTLEMVITTRSSQTVPLPDLVCLTYREAQFSLSGNNLEVGRVFGNPADMENAYVVRQEPAFAPGKSVSMGIQVDLYLSDSPPADCNDVQQ
jgi:D-alanine-D-alanine ligase